MKFLATLAALVALAATTLADVRNGSSYRYGGVSVSVSITANPTLNTVSVTYLSGGESSGPHTGTPGDASSSSNPTTSAAPSSGDIGGNRFRVDNGRMQTRPGSSGPWSSMGNPRKTRGAGSHWVRAGDRAPWDGVLVADEHPYDGEEQRADPLATPVPVTAFSTFPFDGWFGDDVTTLPDGPEWERDV